MQVSQVNDHITHAVIGGAKAVEFGISNSAEFFNILSSTLYKDQILAVVRETLCNAWDAHIEAGYTHIPVQLSLDKDKLVIRDFGKGIHRDDMGLIYGTYGNSTKKNDGMQTGGFGLGCKSPFAYTDHFEVISHHDGVKTIYNLSKSSAAAMGKPGIIPIASFPTTETGLQVSINIKNHDDFRRFGQLVRRIVHNGDMNMTLNGGDEPLNKFGFDIGQANYVITSKDMLLDAMTRVMVRYGNVIYPVEAGDGIHDAHKQVVGYLNKVNSNRRGTLNIVFQAPPHSISVTPSRESLSMQEHTIKTLNTLMLDFMNLINTKFRASCREYMVQAVDQAVQEKRIKDLLMSDQRLPVDARAVNQALPQNLHDLGIMAKVYMDVNYPDDKEFRKQDVRTRLQKLVAAGLLDRGMVSTFLKEVESDTFGQNKRGHTSWLQRRVVAPLLMKAQAAGLDPQKLYVLDENDPKVSNRYERDSVPLVRAITAAPHNIYMALPYLRKIVIVGTSRTTLWEKAIKHEVFNRLGKYTGCLFYHTSMKKSEKEASLAFFKGQGMEVVDLTVKQPWEGQTPRYPSAPRTPAKKGVPSLASIASNKTGGVYTELSLHVDAERIENPEFIMLVSINKKDSKTNIGGWDREESRFIVDLFGKRGGITNNATTYTNWTKKGVPDFSIWFLENVCMEMQTNPRIHERWANHPERAAELVNKEVSRERMNLVKTIFKNKALRDEFQIANNTTLEDKKFIRLWHAIAQRYRFRSAEVPMVEQTKLALQAIPLAPTAHILAAKVINSPTAVLLDWDCVASIMKDEPAGSPLLTTAMDMVRLILK